MSKSAAKFSIALFAMTIVCTVVWQSFVTDTLYNCTDPLWLDFLSPGDWVHSHDGQPIALVPVVTARPMNDPDTIKTGWSVTRLWYLWYSFIGISIVISVFLARIRWIPKQSTKQICEETNAA